MKKFLEWLVKFLFSMVFYIVIGLMTSFAVMLILDSYFPQLGFADFFAFVVSGLVVVSSGVAINDFQGDLDKKKSV